MVVDPRVTPLARQADLHVPLKAGTDLAVALSIHRFLFESGAADSSFLAAHTRGADRLRERAAEWTFERAAAVAGVQPALLESFARLYAESSPALIRCGWGLERNRNGGSAVAAVLGAARRRGQVRRPRRRVLDEQLGVVGHRTHVDWRAPSLPRARST